MISQLVGILPAATDCEGSDLGKNIRVRTGFVLRQVYHSNLQDTHGLVSAFGKWRKTRLSLNVAPKQLTNLVSTIGKIPM